MKAEQAKIQEPCKTLPFVVMINISYVPYSCRHTFSNMLANVAGADKDKAALIGHEDYTTTKKMYQSAEIENLLRITNQFPDPQKGIKMRSSEVQYKGA